MNPYSVAERHPKSNSFSPQQQQNGPFTQKLSAATVDEQTAHTTNHQRALQVVGERYEHHEKESLRYQNYSVSNDNHQPYFTSKDQTVTDRQIRNSGHGR